MLAKPMMIVIIIPIENIPPVMVLYSLSLSYRRRSDDLKKSHTLTKLKMFFRILIFINYIVLEALIRLNIKNYKN